MPRLADWTLHRLRVPLGRAIGDNNCTYEAFDVCALRLVSDDGLTGWGFGEKAYGGRFRKPVSWKAEMPGFTSLHATWSKAWPGLKGQEIADLLERVPRPWESWVVPDYLLSALRMALWDLRGQAARLPLHALLGNGRAALQPFAYASPCCFPQTDEWVCSFFRDKVREGFRAIKVKVGHENPDWDFARLRAVREAVGPAVELAVDANTAWVATTALRWMERAWREGVGISYVEDPLEPTDVGGYRELGRHGLLRVVGHDYVPDPERLRPLLDTGALGAIRMRDGVDHALGAAALAAEYDLPLILCNTFGEHALHVAIASPRTERVEFADLGWNNLFEDPVRAEQGRLVPPAGNGLGLAPRQDRLREWSVHDESL